jgi:hypothetical protein
MLSSTLRCASEWLKLKFNLIQLPLKLWNLNKSTRSGAWCQYKAVVPKHCQSASDCDKEKELHALRKAASATALNYLWEGLLPPQTNSALAGAAKGSRFGSVFGSSLWLGQRKRTHNKSKNIGLLYYNNIIKKKEENKKFLLIEIKCN